jgi:hypothetical protein
MLLICSRVHFRYTIELTMADVGQTELSGEQSRRCLVFKFDLMSYNKTVNDLISVNTRIDQPMKHDTQRLPLLIQLCTESN